MSSAISIQSLSKRFKKHRRRGLLTLKSGFIRFFHSLFQRKKHQEIEGEDFFYALQDINLEFSTGETIGIIGRNGSGKSTLLKLMSGILKPSSGTVKVEGKMSALIELGAGFHPEISGRENIYINGIILGLTRAEIESKFDEIVEFAGLQEFIDFPVRTYSNGMYVRLGFSIAIHIHPDVLLIDEILSVGDEKFSHKCIDKMAEFKKSGKCIVLVSHNLSQIEKFCDRVVWIEKSRVAADGNPRQVIDAYLAHIGREEEELYKALTEKDAIDQMEGEGKRWGSGKAVIEQVQLLDQKGNERHLFHPGDPMQIQVQFLAREKIEEPVFGIAIYRSDGVLCFGSNTHLERILIESIEGKGRMIVPLERLDLVEGSYWLDVAIHKDDGTPYDYHHRTYTFGVRSTVQDIGVFRPPHSWRLEMNDQEPRVLKARETLSSGIS